MGLQEAQRCEVLAGLPRDDVARPAARAGSAPTMIVGPGNRAGCQAAPMPTRRTDRSAALREAAWRSLQGTAAAIIAWGLAKQVGGGHDPFFAPIAAFIALNAPLGERGLNAVRLLAGVLLGIAVGEATVA